MKKERGKLKCTKAHCKCMADNGCPNHHYLDSCFEVERRASTYIELVKEHLAKYIDVEKELLDLYALLVITRGGRTTLEDVHDAWAIWKYNSDPTHKSIVTFDELTEGVQELDREYANAIKYTSRIINPRDINF